MKCLLILVTLFFSFQVFSQDKRYDIYVDLSQVNSVEKSDISLLRKNAFEAILSTKKFNLSLAKKSNSSLETTAYFEVIAVLNSEDDKKEFKLELSLYDRTNDSLVNNVKGEKIPRERLQLISRRLFYSLFYGKNYNEETDKLEVPEIIPVIKEAIEKAEKVKKESVQNRTIQKSNLSKEEEQVPEQQNDVAQLSKDKNKEKKEDKKIPEKVKIANYSSPNISLDTTPKETKNFEIQGLRWLSKSDLGIGIESYQVEAQTVAEVETTMERMSLFYRGNMKPDGYNQFLSTGFGLALPVKKYEYAFGPKLIFLLDYNFGLIKDYFFIGPSVHFENLEFGGVRERGAGVTVYSSKILWGGVQSKANINIKTIDILLNGELSKAFIGSTNLGTDDSSVPVDGSKVKMSAKVRFGNHYGLMLTNETVQLSTVAVRDFNYSGNTTAIHITFE